MATQPLSIPRKNHLILGALYCLILGDASLAYILIYGKGYKVKEMFNKVWGVLCHRVLLGCHDPIRRMILQKKL